LGLRIKNIDLDVSYEYNTLKEFEVVNVSLMFRF
jgi:hypothetical protein